MNKEVELPSHADVQLGEERASETSLEEGHMHPTKGIHELSSLEVSKANGQGVRMIMVEESTLAETNSNVVDFSVQAEVELPRIENPEVKKRRGDDEVLEGLIVPSEGRSGGLALLWKQETFVNIKGYSKWYIDAEVVCSIVQRCWRFTGFYGQLDTSKREETWQILEAFGRHNTLPWLCISDYNEILRNSEKLGGQLRLKQQMDRFREVVDFCRFRDLGYSGPRYTWSRHFENGDSVWARLDCALANEEWMRKFANVKVAFRSKIASSHTRRLYNVDKVEFGHVGRWISALRTTLQRLELQPDQHSEEIRSVRKELNSWLNTEEVMWHQRSRNMYLVAGDRNTRFFHVKASNRNLKNLIEGMEDGSGIWQTSLEAIERIVIDYFSSLFTTSNPSNIERVIETVQAVVAEPMNCLLGQDFQAMEVQQALKQMHPTTALDPDGMPHLFCQKFSSLSGDCVTHVVLNSLNHRITPPDFNDTHIVLIPKTVLSGIVSENQSALTKGQFITDNILVTYETMHYISKKRTGKIGEMTLKLDMSKVYDRVEWACLKGIMEKLGIHRKMVEVVMRCVYTVTYSVRINGKPTGRRSKRNTFNDLKDKFGNKLSGWMEKLLSNAGKEILIKPVAQAIPSHTMSCFKLPNALCDDLARLVRRFWWGQQENHKKIGLAKLRQNVGSKGGRRLGISRFEGI
ncbi:uncharacterized protein LOC142625081 [Castanea sativa]|uniref:uncharacterized protein LOC142625081 n=1 Tax=Castanea sativa TaxID=21020 RepID=UPI003F650AC2